MLLLFVGWLLFQLSHPRRSWLQWVVAMLFSGLLLIHIHIAAPGMVVVAGVDC